jgi:hypothetical protein
MAMFHKFLLLVLASVSTHIIAGYSRIILAEERCPLLSLLLVLLLLLLLLL